jgi:hypothetical protein
MQIAARHISLYPEDFEIPRWTRAINALHDMLKSSSKQDRALDLGDVTLHFSASGQVTLEHGPYDFSIADHTPLPQADNEVVECENRTGNVLPVLVRVATDTGLSYAIIKFAKNEQLVLYRVGDMIALSVNQRSAVAA